MIRTKTAADLQPWLQITGASLVASFVRGVINDEKAVRAAMTTSGRIATLLTVSYSVTLSMRQYGEPILDAD